MKNSFRKRLLANETLIGTLVSIPSVEVVELLASLGFDWLFIDAEHGAFGPEHVVSMLQAAHDCPCLVRIPGPDEAWVKKVLDAGATGIIVPQINNPEQAQAVVNYAKYPPLGRRGVGLGRAHGYGTYFSDYLENANQQTVIVLQAETQSVLNHLDQISAMEHVDAILIGPYDLSASLGHMGDISHSVVQDAIQRIKQACASQKTQLGIFGVCAENIAAYKAMGFTLLTVGVDTLFLQTAASAELKALRKA